MTPPLDVPANEHGVVRVFSLSVPTQQGKALRDSKDAQIEILGGGVVNPDGIEVFAVSDLDRIGLAGYLREGLDADEANLAKDRAKLAALDGWVMLVYSSAFNGQASTLNPAPELTLIGTYGQTPPDRSRIDLESEAAKPYTGTPSMAPPNAVRGRPAGAMVVVGLVVLAVLVLWWLLS